MELRGKNALANPNQSSLQNIQLAKINTNTGLGRKRLKSYENKISWPLLMMSCSRMCTTQKWLLSQQYHTCCLVFIHGALRMETWVSHFSYGAHSTFWGWIKDPWKPDSITSRDGWTGVANGNLSLRCLASPTCSPWSHFFPQLTTIFACFFTHTTRCIALELDVPRRNTCMQRVWLMLTCCRIYQELQADSLLLCTQLEGGDILSNWQEPAPFRWAGAPVC